MRSPFRSDQVWSSFLVCVHQTPAGARQPPPQGPLFRRVIGTARHRDALGSQQFITPSKPISDTRKYAETRDGFVRRERERWTASSQRGVMGAYWLLSAETPISCLKQHWSSLDEGGGVGDINTRISVPRTHKCRERRRAIWGARRNVSKEEQIKTGTDSFTS